jgi:hypothetical protein
MTGEHVPPRSTGNTRPVGLVVDPFDLNSVVRQVAEWDEGHVVNTLDRACNARASDWGYVKEYRRWLELFVVGVKSVAAKTSVDPLRETHPFEIELPYDVHPARFVRHVLAMFLAVQETEHLFAAHAVLPELVGPDPSDDSKRRTGGLDISPLHLYVSVYNGSWSYGTLPMLAIKTSLLATTELLWTPRSSASEVDDLLILCLTPFAFVLTTADANDLGHDISPWTRWSVDQHMNKSELRLALPTADQLQGAIRAMIYPADYVVR